MAKQGRGAGAVARRYEQWVVACRRYFGTKRLTNKPSVAEYIAAIRTDRPGQKPCAVTMERWRQWCNKNGYPVVCEAFRGMWFGDKRHLGCDHAARTKNAMERARATSAYVESSQSTIVPGSPPAKTFVSNMGGLLPRAALLGEVDGAALLLEAGKPVTLNPKYLTA